MDLLDDLLSQAGLRTRILGHRSFHSAISLAFPCSKSIGFHVVTRGQAYLYPPGATKPIHLKKGDIALMSRGCDHIVSTEEKRPRHALPLAQLENIFSQGSEKPLLTLVSGAYQFWHTPVHPFFSEIPDWYVLRSEDIDSFDRLQSLIQLLAEEVAKPDFGSSRAIQGLLDVMFSFILRKIVQQTSERAKTWSHASRETEVRRALELLHADVARAWSLEELAKKVGLSRAGFAQKFKRSLGDTPLHYLTTLRIQTAMHLLSTTDQNLETIASQVGYQDAFGFSKAFKKIAGLPPREFRAQDQLTRRSAERF